MDKLLDLLNFWPGLKTKVAAVAAFALAVVAAWNAMVPELGQAELAVRIPDVVNAIVLALLGVGAANQPKNLGATPAAKP